MATQALYRRYRPRRFGDLKGQDHVVQALRSAVADGREGQAYLFSGPRGTGKTSSARILAKVLNCENPRNGEPCCECESCLAVERGTSYDVHELDAASNNGVDAMRDLIEKASLGTPGRHKVYILDEVHMLSKAAEAALLKTLEEPPSHVVFVLATTDPQKMSDTIRSRTQHLQFHLLPADTLADHVRWVATDAGLDVSDYAFDHVVASGAGSARDTLSALELAANAGDAALDVVPLDDFVEAMIERSSGQALTLIADAIAIGRDPRTLTEELIGHLRNGFLSLMAPQLVQLPTDRVDAVASQAQRLGAAGLVRAIERLGTALVDMRNAPDPRVLLDVVAVQLTADEVDQDVGALLTRIQRLEARLEALEAAPTAPVAAPTGTPTTSSGRAQLGARARRASPPDTTTDDTSPAEPASSESTPAAVAAAVPDASSAVGTSPSSTQEPSHDEQSAPTAPAGGPAALTSERWENDVRPGLRGMARAVFTPAELVASTPDEVTLALPNPVHRDKCEQHRGAVESAIAAALGSAVTVTLVVAGGDPGGGVPAPITGAGEDRSTSSDAAVGAPNAAAPDVSVAEAQASGAQASRVEASRVEASAAPAVALPDDDADIDLDDLVDAPPETVKTPLDRLAEAFPGSELIEESG
ncbi:MAG: DNA polymerase III subunit gamma/tau [Actinomycetota bacterium]